VEDDPGFRNFAIAPARVVTRAASSNQAMLLRVKGQGTRV
jgi:hypothetical protein